MGQINAYLKFNGNAREAMTFYKESLGGELTLQTFGESAYDNITAEQKDKIMHSMLKNDDMVLLASDMGEPDVKKSNVALSIMGLTKEKLEKLFEKLSKGGKVLFPPAEQPFGIYCSFIDKYGFEWLLQADK